MMLRKNLLAIYDARICCAQVLTEHHIKPTSSYGSSYQANKFLRSIISSQQVLTEHHPFKQRRCTKLKQPSPSRLEARAARDSSDSYAALPSSYAIVRMCALRFRRIKRLSWSLRRRLPRRCCRSRRSLEVGAHGILLFRRPSGRSGRSCVVLQHERSAFLEQCAERGDVGYTSRGSRHNGREALWQKSLCAGASPHAEQSAMRRRNG